MYVSPEIWVSMGAAASSTGDGAVPFACFCCRTLMVKLKMMSSLLLRRRRKDGGPKPPRLSGSYCLVQLVG